MSTGKVEIICGSRESGKTALALGKALQVVAKQKEAIVIEFLKGSQRQEQSDLMTRLEPELKIFRFEKSHTYFAELSEEEKREELINIRNGLNYAKKVLTTGECDLLVLDEVLGLLDLGVIAEEELKAILDCRDDANVILTGQVLPKEPKRLADRIERILQVQVDNGRS